MIVRKVVLSASLLLWGGSVVFPAPFAASATNMARVKVYPPDARKRWAGERIEFSVELLARGQFTGAPVFDLPALPDALLLQTDSRPLLGSRRFGTHTWVTQTHEFDIYAQRGGALQVPSFEVRFASKARFDQTPVEHRLEIEGFVMEVEAPPGTDPGAPLLAARDLTAVESWSAGPETAMEVGGALTRTIRIEAAAVPAMLLPTIEFLAPDGASVYPSEPELMDRAERGTLSAQRVDSATYVFVRPGRVELPPIEIRWWDPGERQWQRREFPARALDVAPRPPLDAAGMAAAGGTTNRLHSWRWLIAAASGLIAIVLAAPTLYRRWRHRQHERAGREPAQFARVLEMCRRGPPAQAYVAIGHWLRRIGYSSIKLGVEDFAAARLNRSLELLQQFLIGRAAQVQTTDLVPALENFRAARQQALARNRQALPPLNPTGGGA
jgi:hypothetical protein